MGRARGPPGAEAGVRVRERQRRHHERAGLAHPREGQLMSQLPARPPTTSRSPSPTAVSKPFWDAARRAQAPPPALEEDRALRLLPARRLAVRPGRRTRVGAGCGRGTVYSYTVARRPTAPQWANDGPLIIAIVAARGGPAPHREHPRMRARRRCASAWRWKRLRGRHAGGHARPVPAPQPRHRRDSRQRRRPPILSFIVERP